MSDSDSDAQGKGGGKKGSGKGKGKKRDHGQQHTHPGGSAAVLGARVAKYSSIQGLSLILTNVLHAASIIYVARKLGPADLGRYSLLLFLSGLITQVFHIFSKPGHAAPRLRPGRRRRRGRGGRLRAGRGGRDGTVAAAKPGRRARLGQPAGPRRRDDHHPPPASDRRGPAGRPQPVEPGLLGGDPGRRRRDLQARRHRHLVRAPAGHVRDRRRLAPGAEPRDHGLPDQQGQGGGGRDRGRCDRHLDRLRDQRAGIDSTASSWRSTGQS